MIVLRCFIKFLAKFLFLITAVQITLSMNLLKFSDSPLAGGCLGITGLWSKPIYRVSQKKY